MVTGASLRALGESQALLWDQSDVSFMVARTARAFDANAKEAHSMTTNSTNPGTVLNRATWAAMILAANRRIPR